jgi:hypothetical protein
MTAQANEPTTIATSSMSAICASFSRPVTTSRRSAGLARTVTVTLSYPDTTLTTTKSVTFTATK